MNFLTILLFFSSIFALALSGEKKHHHEDDHVHYQFEYGVEDHHTGDIKSHHEFRHGKHVAGVYTLKEADGTTRIVKYEAGPHTGFKAEVEKIGHPHHESKSGGNGGDTKGHSLTQVEVTDGVVENIKKTQEDAGHQILKNVNKAIGHQQQVSNDGAAISGYPEQRGSISGGHYNSETAAAENFAFGGQDHVSIESAASGFGGQHSSFGPHYGGTGGDGASGNVRKHYRLSESVANADGTDFGHHSHGALKISKGLGGGYINHGSLESLEHLDSYQAYEQFKKSGGFGGKIEDEAEDLRGVKEDVSAEKNDESGRSSYVRTSHFGYNH